MSAPPAVTQDAPAHDGRVARELAQEARQLGQKVAGEVARTARRMGRKPVIVAMGRGGPPGPQVAMPDETTTDRLVELARLMSAAYFAWHSEETDEFGFDPKFADRVRPLFEFLYTMWWRVEAFGLRNVPAKGGALIVTNHSGVLPYDGLNPLAPTRCYLKPYYLDVRTSYFDHLAAGAL